MNKKLLAVVTPPSIYNSFSTKKTFWGGNFTLGEFTSVNMKNCGRHNIRKHRYIKNSENYITLAIYLKFGSLNKMKITSSYPKYYLGRSREGLIISLGLNINLRPKKKARYAITNVSMRDILKIINGLENFPYKGYVQKRPKHEPTESYFYLERQLSKYTTRYYAFNSHVDPVRTELTVIKHIPILHVCDLEKSESKGILADENLLQVCSADKSKSKSVNADESSTKESESESVHKSINTKKNKKN